MTAAAKKTSPAASTKKSSIFSMLEGMSSSASSASGALLVPLDDIEADPEQPRKAFDTEHLENLAESIKEYGVLQPIAVQATGTIPPYRIIAGERRWRATRLAGLTEIPVFVRDDLASGSEQHSMAQLVENANRSDLSDLELAKAVQAALDRAGHKKGSKGTIAKMLDRSPAFISRLLAMLDPDALPLAEEGVIVSAEALARFRNAPADVQAELLATARASGEPVTASMVLVARKAAEEPTAPEAPSTEGTGSADERGDAANPATVDTESSPPAAAVATDPAEAPTGGERAGDGEAGAGVEQGTASHGEPGAVAAQDHAGHATGYAGGEGEESEDADEDGHGDSGAYEGDAGAAGPTSTSGGTSGATTPRRAAVALNLTGEGIEAVLRYFVDKASDRAELRLPADLAIAVIENLGGEVPESADQYANRIKDLLASKTS